ncbi:hypothetical protein OMK64_15100 [Cellulomonas fimi]|uniref:hypothetical protein n=1 Tax=Cellulomonas fimi TaxID=1708 RepID=UPI00234C2B13|nr:hypothetical protein [Cellulomonas fimi]MDC7122861.1 hypothetical protein [Cellulomonas fimi]
MSGTAAQALFDAVALWEIRSPRAADEVIAAAVDALVAGVDSPSLRELAGVPASADYWTLRPLVEATLGELRIPYPGPGREDLEIAATRVMCARLLEGSLTARDLGAWAHSTIGHEGASRLQPFVELDDIYDLSDDDAAVEALEDAARREAMTLLG